jgi:cyclohexadieny/prephenate dehydrogenase
MVKDSDLVIIATPLSSYEDVILKIRDCLKNGVILTDVGSVKEHILNLVEKNIPENVSWIPSHAIAGTEESGPEAGFAEIFQNRWCILTPSKKAKQKDIDLLKDFWKKIGSKIDIMDSKQHDFILSITSHIPHLIAYNIVNTSLNIQDENKSDIVKYSAGGLRDFTRIAASNPIMWRDVFIQNKKNNSKMIDKFIENLKDLKKAIENEDGAKLEQIFLKTKKVRNQIVDAGQDVKKPDFGRK